MHWKITSYIQDCFSNKAKRRKAIAVLSVLSVLVVSVVALQLMQPAITMSSELICVLEEHAHSENCYAVHLTCEQQESEEHAHSETCYSRAMVCGMDAHAHGGECYAQVIEETLAPTAIPTEVPVTEVPVTEVPAEEAAPAGEEVTAEPEVTEEAVITEAPVETEAPVPLAVSIVGEKDLSTLVNETATWQLNTTGAVALSYNVADVVNGVVVVPETGLDPATTSLSWTTSIPGVYHITFTVSDGVNTVSDTATLAVSDGNMVLGLTTDALYASPTNSPIYHISQSGGAAPVKYQVTVLQDETEILSLTDYEQNIFTVAVQSWEKKSTITVNVKAVDANGVTAEATSTLRCSGTLTETPAEWRSAFRDLELTGEWPKDLVAIAETQIGYAESQDNFVIESDGFYGYTRYGDWWHLPYSDWCAMFVSFCMDNAELPENTFPQESNATRMRREYESIGLFARAGGDFVPASGDLIFFDWDGDGKANHVGIVAKVSGSEVTVIEGNHDAEVGKHSYNLNDGTIAGYGLINLAYESMVNGAATEEPATEPTVTPEGETSYYMCEVSEHTHEQECFDEEGALTCEVTEHVHSEECLVAPVESTEPEIIEDPEAAEEVVETEEPVTIEEVVETEEPVTTEEVVETEEPVTTEEVVETEEPVATEEVVETEEPATTEEVVETEEPVATEEVVETEEPVATEEVVETEEPTETEEPVVEPTYYCGLEEHAHAETCFDAEGSVICEVAEHVHTEECTVVPAPVYYCGMEEHVHAEICFDAEGNLICEVAEHAHAEECLVEVVLYCAMEEHLHAEECYDEFETLICELPEHLHSDICTQPQPTRYVYQDRYVYITVEIPEGVTLPFGTELVITPIDQNSDEYANTVNQAKQVTGKRSLEDLVYDISFIYNGEEVEPQGGSVNIRFQLASDVLNSSEMLPEEFDINVVHMKDDYTPELLENNAVIDEDGTVHSVDFSSDSFSTYYVSVNLAGDIDPDTYSGKTFGYNDTYNAFVNDATYDKYVVHTSPLGIAGSFHLVAFDTANLLAHTNGNILAQKLNAQSNFGTNQVADELSYIVEYVGINGGSAAKPGHMLVVGSGHTIGLVENGTAMSIDDVKIERPYTIIKDRNSNTRPFIDLDYVRNQIEGISDDLYNVTSKLTPEEITIYNYWYGSTVLKPHTKSFGVDAALVQNGGWFVSPNGGYYMNPTIAVNNPEGASYVDIPVKTLTDIERRLDLTGFKSGHNGSLIINVDCTGVSGTIDLPPTMLYIDGKQTAASETGEFSNGKIIWNFHNADNVTINTDTMVGSIIAPGATVNIESNINGTVIADVINVKAESHRTDFTGTTRPSTVKDSFRKQVDGKTPKADQNFRFIREEYVNNGWSNKTYATNYGSEFHFNETVYTESHIGTTHWYRVYEAPANEQIYLKNPLKYEQSKNVYLVKVEVKQEMQPGFGMWGMPYYVIKATTTYYRFENVADPEKANYNLNGPSINGVTGKKVGAKDLLFKNTTIEDAPTPTPVPTPTPEGVTPTPTPTATPTPTPTPTPNPQPTSFTIPVQKQVNGLPAAGNQTFNFVLEEITYTTNEETGAVTSVSSAMVTTAPNVNEKINFTVGIDHNDELAEKTDSNQTAIENEYRTYWYRVYEEQKNDAINKVYDISKVQYYIRVNVYDDFSTGAQIDDITYYKSTAVNYDGTLKLVAIVPEYDGDGDVVDYVLNSADVIEIGSTSEMIFNNNEKNRNPNPTQIGLDLRKQINGYTVIANSENKFPAFKFELQELVQDESQNGNVITVTPTWKTIDTKNNSYNSNSWANEVPEDYMSDSPSKSGPAMDLIHFDLQYKFQTDVGVHWYRVVEQQDKPDSYTYANGAVTESETEYGFGDLKLTNSKEQYYVRVEVTMDADYNLHTSTSYYQYPFDAGNDPELVANGTEVDSSKMVAVNDPYNQHVFHNKLEDQPAQLVVDPGALYKTYHTTAITDPNHQKYTFILEQLVGDSWVEIQSVNNSNYYGEIEGQNYSGNYGVVKFNHLTYTEPGTYWYRIRESQKPIPKVVLDTTEYIMKVVVKDELVKENGEVVVDATTGNATYVLEEQTFYKVNESVVYGGTTSGGENNSTGDTTAETTTRYTYTFGQPEMEAAGQYGLIIYMKVDGLNQNAQNLFGAEYTLGTNTQGDLHAYAIDEFGRIYLGVGNASDNATGASVTISYSGDEQITIKEVGIIRNGENDKDQGIKGTFSSSTIAGGSTSGEENSPTENRPQKLPLVIPDYVNGGYTVNEQALVGYKAESNDNVTPPEKFTKFENRVFNNEPMDENKTVEVSFDFFKRIGDVDSNEDPEFRQFEFELYEKNEDNSWTKIQTVKNSTEAVEHEGKVKFPVKFDPIQYNTAGEYWYKVVETQTNVPGYILDKSVYYVRVTVTKNADNSLATTQGTYHVEKSETTGVETITVVKKKATQILKTYTAADNKGTGYIRFPIKFVDGANNLQIRARFGNLSGSHNSSAHMTIGSNKELNFNNIKPSEVESNNHVIVENYNGNCESGVWLPYSIEFKNMEDNSMQLTGIEYNNGDRDTQGNLIWYSADLSNDGKDESTSTEEVEETTTIYTSLFDENGDPVEDALSATSENTLKTFTNTVVKEVYEPIDTELKLLKHVNNELYTGPDKFEFVLEELNGDGTWSKVQTTADGTRYYINNENGEVVFNVANTLGKENSPLHYTENELGDHWYRVTENNLRLDGMDDNKNEPKYIYSKEVYYFKTNVIKQNGFLFANTTTYTGAKFDNGVEESQLTEVANGQNVFHNTPVTTKPNETSINLKFIKRVGSQEYTGDKEFSFQLVEYEWIREDESSNSGILRQKSGGVNQTTTNTLHSIAFNDILHYEGEYGDISDGKIVATYYYKVYERPEEDNSELAELFKFSTEAYLVKVDLTRNEGNLTAKAYYYKWPKTEEKPWENNSIIFTPSDYTAVNALYTNTSKNEYNYDNPSGTVPSFQNTSLNSKELPETGGAGTLLYTAGGLLLMAAALLYWYVTRRKRERRYE